LLPFFPGKLNSTVMEILTKIVRIGVIGCGEIAWHLASLIVGSRHPCHPSLIHKIRS
jgi:hypothetical protein